MRTRFAGTAVTIAVLATTAAGGLAFAAPGQNTATISTISTISTVRVAPYADVSLIGDYPNMEGAISAEHLKDVTAGFIIGGATNGCQPTWNNDSVAVNNDATVGGFIAAARHDGAVVIPSFGGQLGSELALTCTSHSKLVAAYQSVLTHLKATRIDFDIEGAAISDAPSIKRRFAAIRTLEANNPKLTVSLTVPVTPTGLAPNGVAVLKAAKKAHVKVSVLNIMAMDYNKGAMNMGRAAIAAAKGVRAQLRKDYNAKASWSSIGVTAQIGANTGGTTFTLANARKLAAFARSRHFAQLSFWSLDRDQQCATTETAPTYNCSGLHQSRYEFAAIFNG
jgi:hypothetical protein